MSTQKNNLKLSSLSVFFPCYNEAENLPNLIKKTMKVLLFTAEKFELIIVDDGSDDETSDLIKKLQKKYSELRLVSHESNLGYGAAVRSGLKESQYDWIFFTDGDGQFDVSELSLFVKETNYFSVVLGYRKKRIEGTRRVLMANLYKIYINLLFRVHVKDIDCAFKLFKSNLFDSLELFSNGAFISAEILYKLKKNKVKFRQLPVSHLPRRHGEPTGAKLKVILIGLWEPLKLYLSMKLGFKS